MRLRVLLVAGVSLLPTVVGAAGAHGSALPSCRVITDPLNDDQDPVPNDDSALDITGTSLSSTSSSITVVVSLRKINAENSPGYAWQFDFSFPSAGDAGPTSSGTNYFFLLGTSLPGGSDFNAFKATGGPEESRSATGIGAVQGTVDMRKSTVTFVAPASLFRSYGLSRGTKLSGLYTSTWRANGASSEGVTGPIGHVSAAGGVVIDTASTTRTHTFAVTRCKR